MKSAVVFITWALFALQLSPATALTIHIIPHSHCDPGWLNTFEGYYQSEVNTVLNAVMRALKADKTRRFVWAEISFFQRWYDDQDEFQRLNVKELVASGQLEFVGSGWVQNDEANANYQTVINQVTVGHEWVMKNFGVRPRIGWQIDPFGHSSLTPHLFARLGYEALVINRIHFRKKDEFKAQKHMEFVWRGNKELGDAADMFTHVLHTHYSAPKGFDWEEGSMPVSRDNAGRRAQDLVNECKRRAEAYRTSHLLVPFGDDFKFKNADYQFNNMGAVIDGINQLGGGVTAKFSTLNTYFDAVSAESRDQSIKFPLYLGDFFPYADNGDSYWTGYYTSRPKLKSKSREADAFLRTAEILHSLARASAQNLLADRAWADMDSSLQQARRDCALVMHHDGITGTAKGFVVNDYMDRLERAISSTYEVSATSANLLLAGKTLHNLAANGPAIDTTSADKVTPVVFTNSLAWQRNRVVAVTVTSSNVEILDSNSEPIQCQVTPIVKTNGGEPEKDKYIVYFAITLPPLGLNTVFVKSGKGKLTTMATVTVQTASGGGGGGIRGADEQTLGGVKFQAVDSVRAVPLKNAEIEATIANGLLSDIKHLNGPSQTPMELKQSYHTYTSHNSGAYMFRPAGNSQPYQQRATWQRVVTGPVMSEVEAVLGEVTATTRICNDRDTEGLLETRHTNQVREDHELLVRFNAPGLRNDVWHTDNGIELLERPRGDGNIAASLRPTISTATLRDGDTQLLALTRQARGAASLKNGELDLWLHRHLTRDDGRGLGEPPRDNSRYTSYLYITMGDTKVQELSRVRWQLNVENAPLRLVAATEAYTTDYISSYTARFRTQFAPMAQDVPDGVHVLSLNARDKAGDGVILRVIGTDMPESHREVQKLDFSRLMPSYSMTGVRETSAAVGKNLGKSHLKSHRLQFGVDYSAHPLLGEQAAAAEPADRQNTDEAGVFLSKAALDALNKTKSLVGALLPGRHLLTEGESLAVDLAPYDIRTYLLSLQEHGRETAVAPPVVVGVPPAVTSAGEPVKQGTIAAPKTSRTDNKDPPNEAPWPINDNSVKAPAPAAAGKDPAQKLIWDQHSGHSNHIFSELYLMIFCSLIGIVIMVAVFYRLQNPTTDKAEKPAKLAKA